ncbi:MAG TPA: SDR family oxidoreductase, partial [Acidimicrobiales bacterium]|nr:SDR family oxidoreductase [Acidimicrobiales bacterium]
DDMIDVNLRGVWHTAKAAIPAMIEAGRGGSMIFTSSLAGLKGYRHLGAYTAAKHGVNGLMRTLANELAEFNIRVNSVCPGSTDTAMMCNPVTYRLFRPDLSNPTKDDAREVVRTNQLLPMDLIEPVDISELVLWLASDLSRYVTGLAIPVDGGRMART